MFNTEHWTICRQFSKTKFEEKINSFIVLGELGENLLIVTEDGKGYFYNEECDKPILWNVPNIVDAAQGKSHALILNQEGMVYLYGGLFLWTDDQLKNDWKPFHDPVLIQSPHRFISVKCGEWHCLALTKDGKVFAWGKNESYQVGHCDNLDLVLKPHFISELDQLRIVAIDCGGSHSFALTDDGDVYAWGSNSNGQIGERDSKTINFGQFDDRVCLNTKDYRPVRMDTLCPIKAIAAGQLHTLLLTHDGQVYSCGRNRSEQFCVDTNEQSISSDSKLKIVVGLPPICQIGSHCLGGFSIAISFDRTCFIWDFDLIGVPLRLPMTYSTIDSALSLFSLFACLPNLVRVQETKLSQLSSCPARMFDNPDSSDVQFVVEDQIIHAHRSILRNASGHLDQMFSTSWCSVEPTARIVIADHCYLLFHAYLRFLYTDCLPDSFEIITELLKLANSYQEVALQQKCCARLQCNIPGTQTEGDSASCWFILHELKLISPEFLEKVRSFMVMGKDEEGVLMTTENGDVYWFGTILKRRHAATPTKLNVSNIIQMAHGENHILMLNQQGQIFSFGSNKCGQLGWIQDNLPYKRNSRHIYFQPRLISSPYRFVSIQCGKDHSLALTEDGSVFSWGDNFGCQLAINYFLCDYLPTLNRISELNSFRVVQIACGYLHSLALTDDGSVYSWGRNKYNQLGHSVNDEGDCCSVPTRIKIPFPIKSISAGRSYSCLLTQSGQVYLCSTFSVQPIWAASADFDDVPDQRLAETYDSVCLHKIHYLPPISHIVSNFDEEILFAVTFNNSCHILVLVGSQFSDSICPTINLALAFNSYYRFTPCLFQFEGPRTNSMLNCMIRMVDNPEASDVQFVVEKNRTIHAHRAIMQNSSSYFERMFSKTWCPNPDNLIRKIQIADHSYSVFHSYIYFLYTRRLQVSSNDLTGLFELAIYYVEDRLQQLCLERMWCDLSVENCCHYYQLTKHYDSSFPQSFIRNLIQFISVRTRLVYSTDQYRALDQSQQQKLSIDIENFCSNLSNMQVDLPKVSQFPEIAI